MNAGSRKQCTKPLLEKKSVEKRTEMKGGNLKHTRKLTSKKQRAGENKQLPDDKRSRIPSSSRIKA
jgi:hypothetical protein